jgi:hypothetical protein
MSIYEPVHMERFEPAVKAPEIKIKESLTDVVVILDIPPELLSVKFLQFRVVAEVCAVVPAKTILRFVYIFAPVVAYCEAKAPLRVKSISPAPDKIPPVPLILFDEPGLILPLFVRVNPLFIVIPPVPAPVIFIVQVVQMVSLAPIINPPVLEVFMVPLPSR